MIVHVVRCFEDGDVVHVSGDVDPARDIETINIELALADLETVSKRHEKVARARSLSKEAQKHASEILPILQQLLAALGEGKSVRSLKLDDDRLSLLSDLHLLTLKPMIYVCNVDEEGIGGTSAYVDTVKRMAKEEDAEVVVICSKIESEIATLESEKEKQEFLEAVGLKESGLNKLIRSAYHILGLRTFFTTGDDENRAWTFKAGMKAPQTAGLIHSDFQKGFEARRYPCIDQFVSGVHLERIGGISTLHPRRENRLRVRSRSAGYGRVDDFKLRMLLAELLEHRFKPVRLSSCSPPTEDLDRVGAFLLFCSGSEYERRSNEKDHQDG
jgi:hypothetical protein